MCPDKSPSYNRSRVSEYRQSVTLKELNLASALRGKVADHVKMYDEELLKEIMVSTALCVHELLMDDPNAKEEDICEFVETNFRQIIDETITAEIENSEESPGEDLT